MTARRGALLWLYGTKNLVGSFLGIVALGAFFAGAIHDLWFAIVAGAYGIGYLAAPASRELDTNVNGAMDAAEVEAALRSLEARVRGRIPPEMLTLVHSIATSIVALLPAVTRGTNVDETIFTVRRTALDYLPQTLKNYLALPPAYRNVQPIQDGKTATQLLIEQLRLLDARLSAIVKDAYANDARAVVENGAFLRAKFSQQDEFTAS
jgi:hypothetical protein